MAHILALDSSISGDASVSRLLVKDAVQRLLEAHSGATVTYRDLGSDPIPHLVPGTVAGVRAEAETPAERATRAFSDELIGELTAADVVVIGSPMYNFGLSTGLRAWFDHVLRPRVTFAYTEAGVQGLVTGKRAVVIESRGGQYSEGPTMQMDFQEPYLRTLLGFIGLTDVSFVHAEKIGYGPGAREAALVHAKSQIAAVVARSLRMAA